MKINKKRAYVLIILLAVFLSISFTIYKSVECYSSQIERYNLAYLESQAQMMIQDYLNECDSAAELLSCNVFVQNDQVFAFFDYKPLDENPVIFQMPKDVIERCIFYGYAKIEKKFSKYNIVDFSLTFHDTETEINGASRHGGWNYGQERCYAFGKILDDDVNRIEFFRNDVLVGGYSVGDKDYFFIELESNFGNIQYKFYDNNNQLLYE